MRATNWVGDTVMSLPALAALRARFTQAEIVVVAKPWVSDLYRNHPAVSRQIVYDPEGEHRGPRGFWKLVEALRAERFDAAILFQNAFQAAWMAWRAGIPVRVGYGWEGRSRFLTEAVEPVSPAAYSHQADSYLQLLFRAGIIDRPGPIREIRLFLDEAEKAWAAKHLESLGLEGPRFLIGLNPGAAFGPAKRWLPERFRELADQLVGAFQADVIIFGSRAEKPLAEAIGQAMKRAPTVLAGQTTLRQLMALMGECRLFVTNDSGPMHLAAALGVPLVAVFGSTDERATGPLGPRVRIVKHHVPCSPCGLRECPIDFRCMTGITVNDVFKAAVDLVEEGQITHARPA